MGWVLGLMALAGRAQTYDEWFEQTSTRKQYDEQQIGALGTFLSAAGQGYTIMESGLSTISGLKSGEYNLHNNFYSSLVQVNPVLGRMGEVAEILALQVGIVNRLNAALSRYRGSGAMNTGEIAYWGQVYQAVISAGIADVTVLTQILTADQLKMTDDQRMGRIRELDVSMRERYVTAAGMTDQGDMLCQQRMAQQAQIGTVRGLYGLQ